MFVPVEGTLYMPIDIILFSNTYLFSWSPHQNSKHLQLETGIKYPHWHGLAESQGLISHMSTIAETLLKEEWVLGIELWLFWKHDTITDVVKHWKNLEYNEERLSEQTPQTTDFDHKPDLGKYVTCWWTVSHR